MKRSVYHVYNIIDDLSNAGDVIYSEVILTNLLCLSQGSIFHEIIVKLTTKQHFLFNIICQRQLFNVLPIISTILQMNNENIPENL